MNVLINLHGSLRHDICFEVKLNDKKFSEFFEVQNETCGYIRLISMYSLYVYSFVNKLYLNIF